MPFLHLALCNRLQIALKSRQNAQCAFGCHLFLMVPQMQCDFAAIDMKQTVQQLRQNTREKSHLAHRKFGP